MRPNRFERSVDLGARNYTVHDVATGHHFRHLNELEISLPECGSHADVRFLARVNQRSLICATVCTLAHTLIHSSAQIGQASELGGDRAAHF